MKTTIGRITKEQIEKGRRRESRKVEIENSVGWTSVNKVHKSQKDYNRKGKYKIDYTKEY